MNAYDAVYGETWGPEYVAPPEPPCPHCTCCTARLCARGRVCVAGCLGQVTDPRTRAIVAECPCSAETTPGTADHLMYRVREAQRLRAAADAREVVRALRAAGQPVDWWQARVLPVIYLPGGRRLRLRSQGWTWSVATDLITVHGGVLPGNPTAPAAVAAAVADLTAGGAW